MNDPTHNEPPGSTYPFRVAPGRAAANEDDRDAHVERASSSCPALQLEHDPATYAVYPTNRHRCAAESGLRPSLVYQQAMCLTDQYAQCRFLRAPGRYRRLLAPLRGLSGRRGLAAIVALAGILAIAVWTLDEGDGGTGVGPPPTVAAQIGDAPQLVTPATAAATEGPIASSPSADTDRPAAPSTPIATPGAPPVGTHVVEEGDSLFAIAAASSITIDALLEANDRELTDTLLIGEELVIPASN